MININVSCLPRSGSTFIQKVFSDAACMKKLKFIGPGNKPDFVSADSVVCPTRFYYTKQQIKNNKNLNFLIQLRDPRDVLVSQYYYFYNCVVQNEMKKKSQEMVRSNSIDYYVLSDIGVDDLLERSKNLEYTHNLDNVDIILYDKMVLDFRKWIDEAMKHLNLSNNNKNILFNKFGKDFKNIKEINPENITKKRIRITHKRKIIPGDYKQKLKSSTIKILNNKLSSILDIISKYQKFI